MSGFKAQEVRRDIRESPIAFESTRKSATTRRAQIKPILMPKFSFVSIGGTSVVNAHQVARSSGALAPRPLHEAEHDERKPQHHRKPPDHVGAGHHLAQARGLHELRADEHRDADEEAEHAAFDDARRW